MRATPFLALLLLCACFGLNAPAHANDGDDAGAFANNLGHQALAVITDGNASKDQKQAKLETLFSQNVDINWIGQFVLGRFWKSASDQQKQDYLANYRLFTVKHYTSNLSDFTNADFQVSKVRSDDRGGNVVTMRIKRPDAEDVITEFDIRPEAGGSLKVYDITVEGVSMITTQRSEFASVVSSKGLDYLIDQLKQRAQVDQGVAGKQP